METKRGALKMRIKFRIFSIIWCFALCFGLIGNAYAADISPSPAAAYLIENGIVDMAPEDWSGKDTLRAPMFVDAVMAAWFPGQDIGDKPADEWLYEQGFVTKPELARLQDGDVNWIMMWRITLVLSGNWPVPASLFPDIRHQDRCDGVYEDARATAIHMGLATGREFAIARLKQDQFAEYFYKLLTGEFMPVIDFSKDMPGGDLIDYDKSVLTPVNYRAWNGYFKGFGNLPERYVDSFRRDGWRVIMNPVYPGRHEQFRNVQGGLAVYGERQIYLNHADERGLYHEFGHYIMWADKLQARLPALFAAEGAVMEQHLGSYSQTNYMEYFAECVSFWLQDPDGHSAILAEYAPETYELLSGIFATDTAAEAA